MKLFEFWEEFKTNMKIIDLLAPLAEFILGKSPEFLIIKLSSLTQRNDFETYKQTLNSISKEKQQEFKLLLNHCAVKFYMNTKDEDFIREDYKDYIQHILD